MEPTGSFGANLGGLQALKNAMARRGIDSSMLDQVSASAPSGPSDMAGGMPQTTIGPRPTPQGTVQPKVMARSGEMEIALKALAGTVDTENKIARASLGIT